MKDTFILGNTELDSRLILGTGKFASPDLMREVIQHSGARMITVALRRVDIHNPQDNLLACIDPAEYIILPNTSGARDADEAIRLARMARASGVSDWIKLEVTPEPRYLLPDGEETLAAARVLVQEGFKVMPYIHADPVLARKLEDVGTVSVMPLASPIGSNLGMRTREFLRIIIEQSSVPVIVDAGLGKPSDAVIAMEMGAQAVLVNTAIASAGDPCRMAGAFRDAVVAGRQAYLAGPGAESKGANASSPLEWISQL